MDEVKGGGAALEVEGEGGGIGQVALSDFEAWVGGPVTGEKFAGGAGEATDVVAGFKKGVGEAAANIAGGSQDGEGRGWVGDGSQVKMERETGLEPATNSLESCDSTIELLPLKGERRQTYCSNGPAPNPDQSLCLSRSCPQ